MSGFCHLNFSLCIAWSNRAFDIFVAKILKLSFPEFTFRQEGFRVYPIRQRQVRPYFGPLNVIVSS